MRVVWRWDGMESRGARACVHATGRRLGIVCAEKGGWTGVCSQYYGLGRAFSEYRREKQKLLVVNGALGKPYWIA